jgi:hypothetical protein
MKIKENLCVNENTSIGEVSADTDFSHSTDGLLYRLSIDEMRWPSYKHVVARIITKKEGKGRWEKWK